MCSLEDYFRASGEYSMKKLDTINKKNGIWIYGSIEWVCWTGSHMSRVCVYGMQKYKVGLGQALALLLCRFVPDMMNYLMRSWWVGRMNKSIYEL